jgi:hypothetical protein
MLLASCSILMLVNITPWASSATAYLPADVDAHIEIDQDSGAAGRTWKQSQQQAAADTLFLHPHCHMPFACISIHGLETHTSKNRVAEHWYTT